MHLRWAEARDVYSVLPWLLERYDQKSALQGGLCCPMKTNPLLTLHRER